MVKRACPFHKCLYHLYVRQVYVSILWKKNSKNQILKNFKLFFLEGLIKQCFPYETEFFYNTEFFFTEFSS
jgi:hypothetical protein